MITKFARFEFELFTKRSKSDFLRVHQGLGSVKNEVFCILLKKCIIVNLLWGVNQDCCLLRLPWLLGFRCQVSGVRKHVQFFIDLKILHVHIIAIGHLVFPLILTPDT
jgi:hypothetical protein